MNVGQIHLLNCTFTQIKLNTEDNLAFFQFRGIITETKDRLMATSLSANKSSEVFTSKGCIFQSIFCDLVRTPHTYNYFTIEKSIFKNSGIIFKTTLMAGAIEEQLIINESQFENWLGKRLFDIDMHRNVSYVKTFFKNISVIIIQYSIYYAYQSLCNFVFTDILILDSFLSEGAIYITGFYNIARLNYTLNRCYFYNDYTQKYSFFYLGAVNYLQLFNSCFESINKSLYFNIFNITLRIYIS